MTDEKQATGEAVLSMEGLAGWVYFASDCPQFLSLGASADAYLPHGADRLRLMALSYAPLWNDQKSFANIYRGSSFRAFISQPNAHLDETFKSEPVYLVLPIDPCDEPHEIEYQSWLDVLRAG